MTKIYRIQDSAGRGPYKPGWSHVWQEYRCLIADPGKPAFMDEFPDVLEKINRIHETEKRSHFGCAFRTMEQLNNWFKPEEIKRLKGFGYNIVQLEADEILAESENQLVFWCSIPLHMACTVLAA